MTYKSKPFKPYQNECVARELETIERGPIKDPEVFYPEEGMTYEKPKGGEK